MYYFSNINEYYTVMIFGQYFLVFGLIPLSMGEGSSRFIGVPFVLVGICCILIPYFMLNPDILSINIIWDSVISLLLILAFVFAGLGMTFIPIIYRNRLKKVCSMIVCAKIVKYDYTYSDEGRKLYSPIYEFEFNGKKYEVLNNKYSNLEKENVGSILNLKINPNNPNEFIDNRNFDKIIIFIGIILLMVSVPLFIYIINTFEFIK